MTPGPGTFPNRTLRITLELTLTEAGAVRRAIGAYQSVRLFGGLGPGGPWTGGQSESSALIRVRQKLADAQRVGIEGDEKPSAVELTRAFGAGRLHEAKLREGES